jgi:hypothetical protein
MVIKALLSSTAFMGMAPCVAATFGIVSLNPAGESVLYLPRALSAGESVYFQYADPTGSKRCCTKQQRANFTRNESSATAVDALTGDQAFAYRLGPAAPNMRRPFFGIAAVGKGISISQLRDKSIRVRSAAGKFSAFSCTSAEGLHVYGSVGSKKVSDLYLGFDYSIESPSCPKGDRQ